ncbi:Arm DNA-binding domain-containing protein, partial [Tianweitania sp.]|uniref:Arm DNA-binding domain-containing protein n=1 Tax=Tianweitania sp. TaxID=2021634 RepID=UPI002897D761
MPINQLTDKRVQSIKTAGNYPDGGNLYLRVRDSGAKSFIIKATINKKQREWTLGSYGSAEHQFSLAKARRQRDELMARVHAGELPQAVSKSTEKTEIVQPLASCVPLFGPFSVDLVQQIESGFRNAKHREQWRSTLKTYCKPIWDTPVDQIMTDDILVILRPIWTT